MNRSSFALWISLLATSAFIACGDSSGVDSSSEGLQAPVLMGAPDAATLEANYSTSIDAESIQQDLAHIAWLADYKSELKSLIAADKIKAKESKCTIDDADRQSEGLYSQLKVSTRWKKADGSRLSLCNGEYSTAEELYVLLNGASTLNSIVGSSDTVDVAKETTSHMRQGGSGAESYLEMEVTTSTVSSYQYPKPSTILSQVEEVKRLDVASKSTTVSLFVKYWLLSGRYQCAVDNLETTDAGSFKICDITHAGKVVGSLWSDGIEDGQNYIYGTDGTRIDPAN